MVNLKIIYNKEEGNVSRDTGLIKTLGSLKSKGGKGGKGDLCSTRYKADTILINWDQIILFY